MKIAIIGGGNMGGAIAKGVIERGVATPADITISHLSTKMEAQFTQYGDSVFTTKNNTEAITNADYIVLAVKPWLLEEVLNELTPHIDFATQSLISVVAGISFAQIEQMIGTESATIYRVIPNTAIAIGKGVSIIAKHNATAERDEQIARIFNALGATYFIEESMMSAFTSLASCGIAFALRYIDASKLGGCDVGIEPDMSLEVTLETLKGAIAILEHNASQPQTEIDKVTTKGGLTFKGLDAMEREGFSRAVRAAIKESR